MSWRSQALCFGRDPTPFFSEDPVETTMAKLFCRACCVQNDCLEFALLNDEEHGVWGGRTRVERAAIMYGRNMVFWRREQRVA